MKRNFVDCLERTGMIFTGLLVSVLILNFLLMHTVETHTPARFLFSSGLLGIIAIFLRFGTDFNHLVYRLIYRIALTMTIWSLAYAFLPFSNASLYILSLPMIYYWFRLEFKQSQGYQEKDDLITAGIMGLFCFFIFLEQQPLQMILFPGKVISFYGYYWNAPILMLAGILFMRIRKHEGWNDLAPFGFLCGLTGFSLLAGGLIHYFFGFSWAPLLILGLFSHSVFLLYEKCPEKGKWFCGIAGIEDSACVELFYKKLLGATLFIVQIGTLFSLLSFQWHPFSLWLWLGLIWLMSYTKKPLWVSLAFIESVLLIFFAGILWPMIPIKTLLCALLILFAAGCGLRKQEQQKIWFPDNIFFFYLVMMMVFLFKGGIFQPFSLIVFLGILVCWISIPEPPASSKNLSYVLWFLFSGFMIFAFFRGFSLGLMSVWALTNLLVPSLFFWIIGSEKGRDFWQEKGWLQFGDYLEKKHSFIEIQSYLSIVLIIVSGFVLGAPIIIVPMWLLPSLFVILNFIWIHVRNALKYQSVKDAIQAEIGMMGFLFILRWFTVLTGWMGVSTEMDVYILLGAAFGAAGIREVLKRKIPCLAEHMEKSMHVYAVIGWVYSLFLRFGEGLSFAGISGSFILAVLYYWQSLSKNRSQVIVSAVLANLAIIFWFSDQSFNNALFYVCPVAISTAVLAQMFKNELTQTQLQNIRLGCSLSVMGTASVYHVMEYQGSFLFPLIASVVSVMGAIIGIAFHIRIYLFSGVAFFFFNAITLLSHVILMQPPSHVKLIAGVSFLILGLVLTASFLIFQMKRQLILNKIEDMKLELENWE